MSRGSATALLPAGPTAGPATSTGARTLNIEPGSDLAKAIEELAPTAARPGVLILGGGTYTSSGDLLTISAAGLTIEGQQSTISCRIAFAANCDVKIRDVVFFSAETANAVLSSSTTCTVFLDNITVVMDNSPTTAVCNFQSTNLTVRTYLGIEATMSAATIPALFISSGESFIHAHVVIGDVANRDQRAMQLAAPADFIAHGKCHLNGNLVISGVNAPVHFDNLNISQGSGAIPYPVDATSVTGDNLRFDRLHCYREVATNTDAVRFDDASTPVVSIGLLTFSGVALGIVNAVSNGGAGGATRVGSEV